MLSQNIIHLLDLIEAHVQKNNKSFRINTYWHIGRLITTHLKMHQRDVSQTDDFLLRLAATISDNTVHQLTIRSLTQMHHFHLAYPKWALVNPELSWSHYTKLSRLSCPKQRSFYTQQAGLHHWNAKTLARQIQSRQFERSATQKNKTAPLSFLKDNYVLEFTNIAESNGYKERELEEALILQMQSFLTELGDGFSFVAQQKRINLASGKQFFIDLVFYHFILKCFVLIDLKITELSHRDIGQMDMYIRLYEEKWRSPTDQPTIGIVLCPKLDPNLIQYSMISDHPQLFAATYHLVNPSDAALQKNHDVTQYHKQLLHEFPMSS